MQQKFVYLDPCNCLCHVETRKHILAFEKKALELLYIKRLSCMINYYFCIKQAPFLIKQEFTFILKAKSTGLRQVFA